MQIIEKSVCGNYRSKNEDNTAIVRNGTDQVLIMVADGMGGHSHGEVASKFVQTKITKAWQNINFLKVNEAESFIKDLVIDVNKALFDYQNSTPDYEGMGTTLVLALFVEESIIVLNIGDSRCYVMNQRSIEQVTKDHSLVELLIDNGEITREEAFNHPQKNIVTKAMGTSKLIQADVFRLRNKQYNYLLLASDGLTDVLREDEIHQLIKSDKGKLNNIVDNLVNQALNNDSKDNISLVLASLKEGRGY